MGSDRALAHCEHEMIRYLKPIDWIVLKTDSHLSMKSSLLSYSIDASDTPFAASSLCIESASREMTNATEALSKAANISVVTLKKQQIIRSCQVRSAHTSTITFARSTII